MQDEVIETKQRYRIHGWLALSPMLVFLLSYLGASLLLNDFYKIPITVAFLFSSCYAVAITRGMTINERISVFSRGASDKSILLMVWIFILAGAFAQGAKQMGAIDSVVNLTLTVLPGDLLLAGIFIASCFISLSVGTSVGTIAALVPVASGLAVGGSFFGDNLSFISDTTIAATQTQDCLMKDKFRVNILIILPAALVSLVLYIIEGMALDVTPEIGPIEWPLVIPYLLVLILALWGMNVMLVLLIGLVTTGIVGTLTGTPFFSWLGAMGEGIMGMSELIIVTLLAGGMLEMIRFNGGIAFIIKKMTKHIKGKRGAEMSIGILVGLADLCTANNTIAIITTAPIARQISQQFALDKRKVASILDTFSCMVQGIIPYGAQMLIASGLAGISPVSITTSLYYPFCMGICAILAILLRLPRKYS